MRVVLEAVLLLDPQAWVPFDFLPLQHDVFLVELVFLVLAILLPLLVIRFLVQLFCLHLFPTQV